MSAAAPAAAEGTRRKRPAFKASPCYGNKIAKLHRDLKNPSRRGFTGLPADHVDAPRYDPDFTAREAEFLAIVYGATFHEGHRRPYACHIDGSPVDLEWIRDEMRQPISDDMVRRYSKRLERKGYLTVENGVFFTNGQIDLKALRTIDLGEIEGSESGMRIPKSSIPLDVRTYLEEHPEKEKLHWEKWCALQKRQAAKRAALDQKRREEELTEYQSTLTEIGIDVKVGAKKRVTERPWIVEIRFIEVSKAKVGTGEAVSQKRNAHSEFEGVRNPQNGSTQEDASFYGFSEEDQSTDTTSPALPPSPVTPRTAPSSSSSVSAEGTETTHAMGLRPRESFDAELKAKGPINEGVFRQLLANLCRSAHIAAPSAAQIRAVYHVLPAAGRREWLNQGFQKATGANVGLWNGPGVLIHDAETFRDVAWPIELKRLAAENEKAAGAARAEAEAKAKAEIENAYYTHADEWESRTDEASPLERAQAKEKAKTKYARGMWAGLREEHRDAAILDQLKGIMRAKAGSLEDWMKKKGSVCPID